MSPIDLLNLIQAITGAASPLLKDKVQRNETVIKILQKFNLAPEHPPSDFSGIYAYALVEYGIGKPKLFLELFRNEDIKKAFRKAFDNNNPSIILSEIYNLLDTYAPLSEINNLGIDPRREMGVFYLVFCKVAKISRTPSDVLLSQQITTLQKQLERVPTLEGIRIELARLISQNNLALPGATETAPADQCKAIALAEEMRAWLETLSYRFEKYEVWRQDFFEWIINIPVRRNRYDRILIRGIAGEAQVNDVLAIRSSVERERADEGWLVTARRISRAARAEVEKEENVHLGCYTFDELLAQDADFSGYLEWLEAEITRRQIDTKYVPLACTKEEIDSVTGRQIAVSRYEEEDGWIDGYIDRWLDDPVKEHISVLGEFGTGKTWFAFHYAWIALQHYKDAQQRGVELPRLPLVIPLRDYAKAVSVESLFSEFFFRQYKIPLPHYDAFVQLNRMGKLLLIFDGFDEMAARVDRQEMINNFWELAKVVVPGAKVILTCRSEHFPEAKEGRALLNAELQASTALLTGETPQFEVLELEKFNDEQIKQVLLNQATSATVEQVMSNPQLLDLARRPVMTELILEALPDIEAGKPVDMSRVYLYAVRHKMETDIKTERTFTSLADKLYFLCELSWEMLSTDQMSLNYRVFPDRIRHLFGAAVQEEKDLDHWHFDMMGQTMLIRNADGDYTPAHRSLLEFFVAYKFAAEIGALADDFTELARAQVGVEAPRSYTWSSYFGKDTVAPLDKFVSEPLEKLRETFGKAPLSKAVLELLAPMVGDIESLVRVIQGTRGKNEANYVAGNATTLAVKVDEASLEGRDLSNIILKYGDFSNASMRGVNFSNSSLTNCTWTKVLGKVLSLAFSPDSKFLATSDNDAAVSLWEVSTGVEISTFKAHNSRVYSVEFSPDGTKLASGSFDQTIKLWDISNSSCYATLQGHTGSVFSVAFHPYGNFIISGSTDKTLKLWDIFTGECLKSFEGHLEQISCIACHPEGNVIASGSSDKTVKLWNVHTGECLKTLYGHTENVSSIAFSPQGNLIASASHDHTIRLWDFYTATCVSILAEYKDEVQSITFHPQGKILICGSYDGTIKLLDVETNKCIKILRKNTKPVLLVAINSEGNVVASSSSDSTLTLWDINTEEYFLTLLGHTNRIFSVAFNPQNGILASGGSCGIKLWNIQTTHCTITLLQEHNSWVNSVAYSPCGKLLVSGSDDRTIKIWDTNTNKCLKTLKGHFSGIKFLTFSPNGDIFASTSFGHKIRIWDSLTGDCLKVLQGHSNTVWSVAFNSESTIVASSSSDRTIKLWDVRTSSCLNTLQGHSNRIYSVAFHPQEDLIVSCSHDKTIRLWDYNTGICLQILQAHTNSVLSVAFHPQGDLIASCSDDKTVRLWDISTGECIQVLEGHTHSIESVAFTSDGSQIASCGAEGIIKIWDVTTGKCINTLADRPYERMNITGATGLTASEKATLKALGAIDEQNL